MLLVIRTVAVAATIFATNAAHSQHPTPDDFTVKVSSGGAVALAVQEDGRIVIGGYFSLLDGLHSHFARLEPDGTIDKGFRPKANNTVYTLAVQTDGKVLAGGQFTTLGDRSRNGLGRVNADGTLDDGFNPNANHNVYCLALQPDGKILVGGFFTTIDGQTRRRIARLDANGALDAGFNPGADGAIKTLLLQPDGKILVGGQFSQIGGATRGGIARLNTDGTVDTSFDAGNFNPFSLDATVLQSDGKVIVGGSFSSIGGQPRINLGRLHVNGTVDLAYNPGASGGWLPGPRVSSLTLQADGKIVVGGVFGTLGGAPRENLGRLNPDGTVDVAFTAGANNQVTALALQADGHLVVSGGFSEIAGAPIDKLARLNSTDSALASVQYNPNTSTVTWLRGGTNPEITRAVFEHSPDGTTWVSLGQGTRIIADWQLAGVVVTGGTIRARGSLAGDAKSDWFTYGYHGAPLIHLSPQSRTNNAGTSATFSASAAGSPPMEYRWFKDSQQLTDGTSIEGTHTSRLSLGSLLKANEGSYWVRASNGFGSVTSRVAVLSVVDPVIDEHPVSISRGAGEDALLSATASGTAPLEFQWYLNGNIVAGANGSALQLENLSPEDAGLYTVSVSNQFGGALSRPAELAVNLVLADASFEPEIVGNNAYVFSFVEQTDGKILVGGLFNSIGGQPIRNLARLHADGNIDVAFNPDVGGTVNSLAIQADGKILVGGQFMTIAGQPHSCLGRLNNDGSIDDSFNAQFSFSVHALAVQADGGILVGGSFSSVNGQSRNFLARLNANGTLDGSFNASANGPVYCLAIQQGGAIVFAGGFTSPRNHIGRLNSDGTLDFNFFTGVNAPVAALALQSDGAILIGGQFSMVGLEDSTGLARLYSDGTIDGGFKPILNGLPESIAIQTDGRIVLGGAFTRVNGQPRTALARLNPDGTSDSTFNPIVQHISVQNVNSVSVQSDGRILAGGNLVAPGGGTRHVARFHNSDPATQQLTNDATSITWLREGTGPHITGTSFEHSSDGNAWTSLGMGARVSGGWRVTGIPVPQYGFIRARGLVAGGGAYEWFTEMRISRGTPVILTAELAGMDLLLNWTSGVGPYTLEQSFEPTTAGPWETVATGLATNSISLPLESTNRFYRIRLP